MAQQQRLQRAHFPAAAATAVTLAVFLLSLVPLCLAQGAPIFIGTIQPLNFSDEVTQLVLSADRGLRAAFHRANLAGGIDGRPVQLAALQTDFVPGNYPLYVQQLTTLYPDLMAVTTLLGTNHTAVILPKLRELNLMHISPPSADTAFRGFVEENVFLRPDYWAELVALTTQLVRKFRIRRIAVEYTINLPADNFGVAQVELMTSLLRELGLTWCYEFKYDYRIKTGEPTTFNLLQEVGNFLNSQPEAVVSFGTPNIATAEFIVASMQHPLARTRAPNLRFFVTEPLAMLVGLAFSRTSLDPTDRVFSTFTFPITTDTSYAVTRSFLNDMTALYGPTWPTTVVGYTAIGGYIGGRFIVEALKRATPLTKTNLKKAIFSSTIIEIDDLVYGIYKGDCVGMRTANCRCNEGAHKIDLGTLSRNYTWSVVSGASFEWDISTCTTHGLRVDPPTNYLQMTRSGEAIDSSLAAILRRGKERAENASGVTGTKVGDIAMRTVPITSAAATQDAIDAIDFKLLVTTAAFSTIGEAAGAALPWAVVDPFTPRAELARPFSRSVLHVSTTLQQEMHAAAYFASRSGTGRRMHLLATDAAFVEPLERSCTTFGVSLSSTILPSTGDFAAGIARAAAAGPDAVLMVAGVTGSAHITSIFTALGAHTSLQIVVPSNELFAHYDAFVAAEAALLPSTVGTRLLVATNLPNWGPAAAAAVAASSDRLLTSYYSQLRRSGVSAAHPLELRAFIATRVVLAIREFMPKQSTSDLFLRTFYFVSNMFLDPDVVLGPFFDAPCNTSSSLTTCECNVGVRHVRVFSLGGVLRSSDPSPAAEFVFDSCRIAYSVPSSSGGLHAGAIAGIVCAAVVFAGVLAVALLRGGKQRDTKYAPKDASKPVTIVFTDIQGSTSLWARVPEQMGPALDQHHEIIRGLIKKHRGYEVKTVGDAFVIAFEDADAAVALCEDLQWEFYRHDWGTTALDETYRQLEQEALEENPRTDAATTCTLPPALYEKSWNGLRVRCGINTGIVEIKFDPITLGYDFYGNHVNIAARVEAAAHGGQVCMTTATADALKSKEKYAATSLGPVLLRGCSDPIEILQLDVVPGRAYARLRIDLDDEESTNTVTPTIDSPGTASLVQGSVRSGESTATAAKPKEPPFQVRDTLTTLFSTFDVEGRNAALRKIAGKWRVHVSSNSIKDKATESNELTSKISNKVTAVLKNKAASGPAKEAEEGWLMNGGQPGGGSRRASLQSNSMGLPGQVPTPTHRDNAAISPGGDKFAESSEEVHVLK